VSNGNILIVDDYRQLVGFLTERLTAEGYTVQTAVKGSEARAIVQQGFSGVILLDVRLPDIGGLDLFQELKAANPNLPVIFITAHATLDLAVEATRQGAFDFMAKGSDLMKRLTVSVKNAFDRLAMHERVLSLETQLSEKAGFERFLTVSPRMRQILKTLESIVNSGVSVLIEGESGTGKEVVARAIHASGSRKNGPFVAVNCAGIPETLLESEMFGYEKGAFTGATQRRAGKFEAAHGGTLFLDEVGELPKALQAKLLRVLQDHTFQRVGGNEPIFVDVRILSATNRDLMGEVRQGAFRDDLFYRLSVFPVRLPPLRDRPEDVPILAQHFLKRFAKEEGKVLTGLDASAIDELRIHPWPGNVRELENVVRHAVILAREGSDVTGIEVRSALGSHRNLLAPSDPLTGMTRAFSGTIDERIQQAFPDPESLVPMKDVQAAYLKHALKVTEGNVSKASRALDMGRATLYRWLDQEDKPG
jgi:DNA-binding NtrC family response regulator